MSISVDNLEKIILHYASLSDEIIVISGYFSTDILEKLAKTRLPIHFYYGMYLKNGLSTANYTRLNNLSATYPNLEIKIPYAYHVHTKCYLFRKAGITIHALVGSANCSSSALSTTKNSELLMDVSSTDISFLDTYAETIDTDSIPHNSPAIVPSVRSKVLSAKKTTGSSPLSWHKYSGNPFSAIIPLYKLDSMGKPFVQVGDGLNWGLGPTHHTASGKYAEASIPIRAFIIDNHPTLIPFHGAVGSGTGGKITRRQSSIDVLWDDGTVMAMHFEGNGPTRPTKAKCSPGTPYRIYPKQLTSSSGGAELGKYIRKRLGVSGRSTITYNDLVNYGRDYITFTLTNSGDYEIDFGI